jgi:hypothetical protein
MRRATAITLLLLFGWLLAAPLLAADPERNLPPCCRRHGKHHCAMMDRLLRIGAGPVLTTLTEPCPCRQAAGTATSGPGWRPATSPVFFAGHGQQPLVAEPIRNWRRTPPGRSHRKRGPPLSPAA